MVQQQDRPRPRIPSVLEDPGAQAVAQVYADAFLNAAKSAGVEDALEEFASFIEDVLERNPEFHAVLVSGLVSRDEKMGLVDRIVAPTASELFTNFLRVLVRHGRLNLLPIILKESQVRQELLTGRRRVEVSSAVQLSDELAERIRDRLAQSMAFEPILQHEVDPSLLGGVVIRIGDTVYDSSLRTRLKQLRGRLRRRSVHEIQSERNRFSD